jgi:hypothetical protein
LAKLHGKLTMPVSLKWGAFPGPLAALTLDALSRSA